MLFSLSFSLVIIALSTPRQPAPTTPDPLLTSLARARELAPQVSITRDQYGVPHIHAPTDAAAVFGAMYARAEDEMARIELGHAQSIGLAAQLHGEEGVPWDRLILSYQIPSRAKEGFAAAPPQVRDLAQAAADALNLYADLHHDFTPRAIRVWEPWMFFAREYAWTLYHAQEEITRVYAKVHTTPNPTPAPAADAPPPTPDGSNAWAIGPSRTRSGRPMLYMNPHIPLDEVYELELRSDQGLHVSGMVAYGAGILPMIAHNDHLGWSLTVNYPDLADTYAITFDDPDHPLNYRSGTSTLTATAWQETIRVKTPQGLEDRTIDLLRTHQGPVLFQEGRTGYVVRVPKLEDLRGIEQMYLMARASTLADWKQAVSLMGVVFHNLVYADDQGNIGYIYNAAMPVRDPSFDWSGVVDGSDPRTDWKGYHTLDQLPQVWNPAAGYLLSCNSPPTMVTADAENIKASDYPAYMIGHDLIDGRIPMSKDILSNAAAWTLDDLEHASFDTKVYGLEPSRGALIKDFDALAPDKSELQSRLAPAIEFLKDWDGRLAPDSVPSSLFMVWIERVFSPAWAKRRAPGDLSAALAQVMDEFAATFNGDWRVPWSEINRHQRFDSTADLAVSDTRPSLPITGGHGGIGVSFCYLARPAESARRYGYHGHSYVAAVEFTGAGPVTRSIVPFGASRDPASPHYADQAPLYASGHFKPAWFTSQDVQTHAERTYHPGE